MEIKVTAQVLKKGLTTVKPATSKIGDSTNQAVLITASGKLVSLITNNGNMAVETVLEGNVKQSGQVVLPLAALLKITGKMPKDEVITISDGALHITVRGDATSYQLIENIAVSEFPVPEAIDITHNLERYPIKKCLPFVIEGIDTRTMLDGVHIEAGDGFTYAATSGKILKAIECRGNAKEHFGITIPTCACKVLAKWTDKDIGIGISADTTRVLIRGEKTDLYALLQDSNFPEWRTMRNNPVLDKSITVEVREFLAVLDRVSAIGHPRGRKVLFEAVGSGIYLSVHSPTGEAKGLVTTEPGDTFTFAVNYDYLKTVLTSIDAEQAMFRTSGTGLDTVIVDGDSGETTVIMPMR